MQQLDELRHANLNQVHDHAAMLHRIGQLVQDVHSQAIKIYISKHDDEILVESLFHQLKALNSLSSRKWMLEHNIVESLYYECITVRHESIPDAHANTFDWILDPDLTSSSSTNQPNVTLQRWLTNGSGLYWVSGKPGSGKSTLMKFIADHRQTQAALSDWAGEVECTTVAYYFWSAGTRLQKSIEGLLRSLLFDIFTRRPELMKTAVPDRWNAGIRRPSTLHDSESDHSLSIWTVSEMTRALCALASKDNVSQRFCIFVDGLDEYHGNPLDIIKILESLSQGRNIKLCVSSRPWNIFEDNIGLEPSKKLYIHELTASDIYRYTNSRLQEDINWRDGALIDPRYTKLIHRITDRAQGVFLWVVLVVRSVLEGISDGDSIQMLECRIEAIPQELGPFFRRILSSVSTTHHKRMAMYFRVAQHAPHSLSLMHYSFLDQCIENYASALTAPIQPMDNHDIFFRNRTMMRRLNARCKGLLEAHTIRSETRAYLSQRVTFLHRTVRDYFMTDEMQQFLESILDDYPLNTTMLMSYLAFMKAMPPSGPALLEEAYFYAVKAEVESPDDAISAIDELHGVVIEQGRFHDESEELVKLPVEHGLCAYVSACAADNIIGFQDVTGLLEYAVIGSTDAASDHVDPSKMISMLLGKGGIIDGDLWETYLDRLALLIKETESNANAIARHEDILKLLLPSVGMAVPDSRIGGWSRVMSAIVLKNWSTIPRATMEANVDLITVFLRHGADPNTPFEHLTLWAWLCKQIRINSQGRSTPPGEGSLPAPLSYELPPHMLAKVLELFILAGADLTHRTSLTEADIRTILPQRSANRIIKVMKEHSKAKARAIGWVKWIASFVLGNDASA